MVCNGSNGSNGSNGVTVVAELMVVTKAVVVTVVTVVILVRVRQTKPLPQQIYYCPCYGWASPQVILLRGRRLDWHL